MDKNRLLREYLSYMMTPHMISQKTTVNKISSFKTDSTLPIRDMTHFISPGEYVHFGKKIDFQWLLQRKWKLLEQQ